MTAIQEGVQELGPAPEEFTLSGYQDGDLTFTGHLFSEGSFFDDDSGALTRLRLFVTSDKRLVYSVISGTGAVKTRRVYELHLEDGVCHINNGAQSVSLPTDMLFVAVFGLCGLAPSQAGELRATLEESLRAVGS